MKLDKLLKYFARVKSLSDPEIKFVEDNSLVQMEITSIVYDVKSNTWTIQLREPHRGQYD